MKVQSEPPISMKCMDDHEFDITQVDVEIRPVVTLLREAGFKTFTSCSGGKGHCFNKPIVRFHSEDLDEDSRRAYQVLSAVGYDAFYIKIYCREYKLDFLEVEWWGLRFLLDENK